MTNKKVLIIDDDLNVCKEIKYSLQNETTDAYYALSAHEGVELLAKHQFCLVIMDIILSETDGMELLKLVRRIKPIPILILSSKPGSKERIAALKAECAKEPVTEIKICVMTFQGKRLFCLLHPAEVVLDER